MEEIKIVSTSLHRVPPELVLQILELLPPQDLVHCSIISKAFNHYADELLYKQITISLSDKTDAATCRTKHLIANLKAKFEREPRLKTQIITLKTESLYSGVLPIELLGPLWQLRALLLKMPLLQEFHWCGDFPAPNFVLKALEKCNLTAFTLHNFWEDCVLHKILKKGNTVSRLVLRNYVLHNAFTIKSPTIVFQTSHLTHLELHNCQIVEAISCCIQKLDSLTHLTAHNCPWVSILLSTAELTRLDNLDLYCCFPFVFSLKEIVPRDFSIGSLSVRFNCQAFNSGEQCLKTFSQVIRSPKAGSVSVKQEDTFLFVTGREVVLW